MAVHADLHVHTTNSDGALALADVPAAARDTGVAVVAITDHDRVHPGLDRPVVERDDVTLVHGVELRVEPAGGERVDLLGYGVRKTPALTSELDRLQADRVERGRAIVERVEDRLGVDLGVDVTPGFGRPHVARAVVAHPDTEYDTTDAVFRDLVGNDGPCFVARDVTDLDTGRALLADACALVGLAHPLRYDDPDAALELCADLDAVERYYPYGREVDPAPVDHAIERHDLLPTGGSDAHDATLGRAGLTRDQYRHVADALESHD